MINISNVMERVMNEAIIIFINRSKKDLQKKSRERGPFLLHYTHSIMQIVNFYATCSSAGSSENAATAFARRSLTKKPPTRAATVPTTKILVLQERPLP